MAQNIDYAELMDMTKEELIAELEAFKIQNRQLEKDHQEAARRIQPLRDENVRLVNNLGDTSFRLREMTERNSAIILENRNLVANLNDTARVLENTRTVVQAKDQAIHRTRVELEKLKNDYADIAKDFAIVAEDRNRLLADIETVRYAATHDSMTGVLNRRGMALAAQEPAFNYCHVVDLDGLKEINDGFGHAFGDDIIKDVARFLRMLAARDGGVVARIGGDEFVVLSYELIDWPNDDRFSVGTASLKGLTLDESIRLADHKMYGEKNKRNNIRKTSRYHIANND
jgi:GGDEF domain-containing protein